MKLYRPPTDSVRLDFKARCNPLDRGDAGLDPFFAALEAHAGEWKPNKVDNWRRNYSRAAAVKTLKKHVSALGNLGLTLLRAEPFVVMSLGIKHLAWPTQFSVTIEIYPLSLAEAPERATHWSRALVELLRAWSSAYPVTYAHIHGSADEGLTRFWLDGPPPSQGPELAPRERLKGVFWLNVLGQPWVDALGRRQVLSTPAHHLEELPNGAVLFLTRPTLADWRSEEARRAQARAMVHLRPELDFDSVLRELLERSARFEPVEPRFDPDSAPLFKRVVEFFGAADQQAKIAELNAYQPPEVDEWLPANASPPSDVTDPTAAIASYREWADVLSILLHHEIADSFKASPEALTDLDVRLWEEKFPESYEREKIDGKLFPSVGAYLGEMLVRHLGGRWVPRRNVMESQVIVADRAWLPFLRTRRYLESTRALLDYSLTKFYRAAARHAQGTVGRLPSHSPGTDRSS